MTDDATPLVIDDERDSTEPVSHHFVHGHFEGTEHRFAFYFPPLAQWDGRFFQAVYPVQDELARPDSIAFGAASGAYVVQATGALGFGVAAAAARFSRTVAGQHYGTNRRIYGFVFGGSGGSLQTIGAVECTRGIWDGAVPFVNAVPTSIPSNFTIRALASFTLRHCAEQLADCVRPGGPDPYSMLDEVDRATLREATTLGIPLRAWENFEHLAASGHQGVLQFLGVVRALDPTYADDFWSAPGYLGTEPSPLGDRIRAAKVDHVATVVGLDRGAGRPIALRVDSLPFDVDARGLEFHWVDTDDEDDEGARHALRGSLDVAAGVLTLAERNDAAAVARIAVGAQLHIDNRWYLAMHAYHRHQIPAEASFSAWDQYKDADGAPTQPQRTIEVGPIIASGATGGAPFDGAINAKVIVIDNLLDGDAFPWHGDWYAHRVEAALGDRFHDTFRLWFNDHADHEFAPQLGGSRERFLVPYAPMVYQALRDVSAWVEHGVAPPASSTYKLADGQIILPESALERRGIQPVVDLTANGANRIEVAPGETVELVARIDVPDGSGSIVAAEWDVEGTGEYVTAADLIDSSATRLTMITTHRFDRPDTYFPAVRVTCERNGERSRGFTGIQNLGRARVLVGA
jgi:hypothetical protein